MTDVGVDLLQRGYRAIRRVSGGAESPWPGVLTTTPDGGLGVVVEASTLPSHWRGWDAATSGHLLTPLDILRRSGGHSVFLPVCAERVADFIDRRSRAHAPLSEGEAVTIAVSLLRAVAELGDDGAAVVGAWWLTQAGRPVLATQTSDGSAHEATSAILAVLLDSVPSLQRSLRVAGESLERGTVAREIDHLEDLLFAAQSPEPLAVAAVGPSSSLDRVLNAGQVTAPEQLSAPKGVIARLTGHFDADWTDSLSRATTSVWRAVRTRRAVSRRAPWIVAASMAGLILIGGLAWPSSEGNSATANAPGDTARDESATSAPVEPGSTTIDSASSVPPENAQPTPEPDDLASHTAALLSSRTQCAEDGSCLSQVQENPATSLTPGVIDLSADERTLTMLDEFGGVAVLRVDATSLPADSQLVVIVNIDGKWLLRDVHDVAQQ